MGFHLQNGRKVRRKSRCGTEWLDIMMECNVYSAFYCSHYALAWMVEQGGASSVSYEELLEMEETPADFILVKRSTFKEYSNS